MNKEEYQKALKDPKWISKRDFIKKRDNYKCVKCESKDNLHVHHKYYLAGKMPWEVPNDCLITLCQICHEKEHEGRDIVTFMRTNPPNKKKAQKKKKPAEKIKKLRFYKFMAVKSATFKQIFDKSTNWKKVNKPKGCITKGFDDIKLAQEWLEQKLPQKKKQNPSRDKVRKDLKVFKYIAIKSDKVKLVLKQTDMWLKALDDHRKADVKGFNNEILAREWVNI